MCFKRLFQLRAQFRAENRLCDYIRYIDGPPILATSSTAGTIAVWDLNAKGKLLHTIRDAHEAGVTGLQFVGGLLISSAGDNGVKVCTSRVNSLAPAIELTLLILGIGGFIVAMGVRLAHGGTPTSEITYGSSLTSDLDPILRPGR
jgi:WD40 repeat protein